MFYGLFETHKPKGRGGLQRSIIKYIKEMDENKNTSAARYIVQQHCTDKSPRNQARMYSDSLNTSSSMTGHLLFSYQSPH